MPNFDQAVRLQKPNVGDKPGVSAGSPYNIMAIASSSKEKDAAFQELEVVFSDAVQTAIDKYGMPSPLKDDNTRKYSVKISPA